MTRHLTGTDATTKKTSGSFCCRVAVQKGGQNKKEQKTWEVSDDATLQTTIEVHLNQKRV